MQRRSSRLLISVRNAMNAAICDFYYSLNKQVPFRHQLNIYAARHPGISNNQFELIDFSNLFGSPSKFSCSVSCFTACSEIVSIIGVKGMFFVLLLWYWTLDRRLIEAVDKIPPGQAMQNIINEVSTKTQRKQKFIPIWQIMHSGTSGWWLWW